MRPLLATTLAFPLLLLAASCATVPPALQTTIVAVEEEYANINTDITEEQMAAAGIVHGDRFVFEHRGAPRTVTYVVEYDDVGRGEWLGRIGDGDALELAISFGNACTETACEVGDVIRIRPVQNQ